MTDHDAPSCIAIPFGYYRIDMTSIPPISRKKQVTDLANRVIQTHMHIQSPRPFMVSSPFITRQIPQGEYFVWNSCHAKWRVHPCSKEEAESIQVFDHCEIPDKYAFLRDFPYIQLGEWDLYYYEGELVDSPLYWKDQIKFPLTRMPSFLVDNRTLSSYLHVSPDISSRIWADTYVHRTLDVEWVYMDEKEHILHLTYRSSVVKYMHDHFMKQYAISIRGLSHNPVFRPISFSECASRIRNEHPHRRHRLPGITFVSMGTFEWTEDHYDDMVRRNRLL